jgi:methylmalonyl-CoA/ethylmalonyl-CoA epimerase
MRDFTISGINHLGIAPKDPNKCSHFFKEILGLKSLGEELVKEQKTLTVMFASSNSQGPSEARLELLVPEVDSGSESPIAKFLEKKGAGIHHVALTVDSVEKAISYLVSKGIRMIDTHPRRGAHGTSIAFIHPESTGGVLLELVQEGKS